MWLPVAKLPCFYHQIDTLHVCAFIRTVDTLNRMFFRLFVYATSTAPRDCFFIGIKTFIHFCILFRLRWIRRQLDGQSTCLSACITQACVRSLVNGGRQPKGNMCSFSIFDDLNDSLSLDWDRFMVRNWSNERQEKTRQKRMKQNVSVQPTEYRLKAIVIATATTKK